MAVIGNPQSPFVRNVVKELELIAPTRHLKLLVVEVDRPEAIDSAFLRARQAQAVLIPADPLMVSNRGRVIALAAKYRLPCMYGLLDFADSGGLMAYGPDTAVMFRRAAEYVDRILRGSKPADLPIEQPTKFELVVNLKTAKALGLAIPESVLLQANEVIR